MKALAPFSIAGVLSSLFVTCFVALRCPAVVPASPYRAGGLLATSLPASLRPQFGTYNRVFSAAPVVLVALGCVAWMGHFSAPEFYNALGDSSSETAKVEAADQEQQRRKLGQYRIMTVVGYSVVAVLNAAMLSCGFLTFGGSSQGNILNNYAVSDAGAALSRFLVSVSVGSGYPLLFSAGRSSLLGLLGGSRGGRGEDGSASSSPPRRLSVAMLGLITAAALAVRDAGFVVSLIGAIAGTTIIYVFPSLLFLKHFRNEKGWRWRAERTVCRILVGFGAVSAAMGTVAAVLSTYFPSLLQ
jgi:amino acid permease